jgi:hypothetical protein
MTVTRDELASMAQALTLKYSLTAADAVQALKQLTSSKDTRARLSTWMESNMRLMAAGMTAPDAMEVGLLLAWLIDAGDLGYTDVFPTRSRT